MSPPTYVVLLAGFATLLVCVRMLAQAWRHAADRSAETTLALAKAIDGIPAAARYVVEFMAGLHREEPPPVEPGPDPMEPVEEFIAKSAFEGEEADHVRGLWEKASGLARVSRTERERCRMELLSYPGAPSPAVA